MGALNPALVLCVFSGASFLVLLGLRRWRDQILAVLSLGTLILLSCDPAHRPLGSDLRRVGLYVAAVVLSWGLLRWYAATRRELAYAAAFLVPVGLLVTQKAADLAGFLGASYVAFRVSYLAFEVRNGKAVAPSLVQHVGFSFFTPTIFVGPISPYERFATRVTVDGPSVIRCVQRILVGVAKYGILANWARPLTFTGLWNDGYQHGPGHVVVSAVAYFFFLYWNFSGCCDIAIGGAGLAGVSVAENFDAPLRATNLHDFWRRWHITLSGYVRDVFFTPASVVGLRHAGPRTRRLVVPVCTLLTFLVIGVWHGLEMRFAAFGLAHGLGLTVHHVYEQWLRRRVGAAGIKRYEANVPLRVLRGGVTLGFVVATMILLENTPEQLKLYWTFLQTP